MHLVLFLFLFGTCVQQAAVYCASPLPLPLYLAHCLSFYHNYQPQITRKHQMALGLAFGKLPSTVRLPLPVIMPTHLVFITITSHRSQGHQPHIYDHDPNFI